MDLPRSAEGFPNLVRAIVFQQISGSAGASILARLRALYGHRRLPPPGWFLRTPADLLQRAGLSPQKRSYLDDLARRVEEGRLDFALLREASDDRVIEVLTQVKGIGPWTAQMYLIFALQRPDVLPSADLGIRQAVALAWGYRSRPAPRTVERIGRRWAPFRSYAAYYLWSSLERPGGGTVRLPITG